jgi:formylmethanofuran dehydrogenase subunit D
MATKRFVLNSARSSRQGTLINVGKDSPEYVALTNTMTMAPADMQTIGLAEGQKALVRTEFGEAAFTCQGGKIPEGMIFVPYGPPTCKLMGGDTNGTGMPTSKGWEVEVLPLPPDDSAKIKTGTSDHDSGI